MICQPDLLEIRHSCYAPMTKDGEEWRFFPIVSFWSLAIFHRSQRFLILSLQFLRVSMVPKIDTAEVIFPHASFLVVYSSSSKFSFQWFTKTSITSLLHKVRVFFSFFFLHIYSLNISSIILSMPHWLVVYNVPSYNILSAKYIVSPSFVPLKVHSSNVGGLTNPCVHESTAKKFGIQCVNTCCILSTQRFFNKNIASLSNKCAQ